MKKVVLSFLGFAFSFMATNASAVDIDLGIIPMTGGFEVVTFSNFVPNDSGDPEGTTFTDTFTFTIVDTGTTTDISIVRLPLTQLGFEVLLFDQFQTSLINGGDVVLFDDDGQSGDLQLAPDTYTIQITGRAAGLSGGLYTGAVAVSVIPIPAAGLLFFSGIAALGLVRSKRASA